MTTLETLRACREQLERTKAWLGRSIVLHRKAGVNRPTEADHEYREICVSLAALDAAIAREEQREG